MSELREICRRVTDGDREAFAEIVRSTATRLVRVASRIMGDQADGEDVIQDAYGKAFDALAAGHFDGRSSVETWLYRIVSNTALDGLRQRRRRDLDRLPEPAPSESTDAVLDAREALRTLEKWLNELAPDQRVALVLKEMEGLSTAEIARVLEVSEGATEQLLVRARTTLRARREHERRRE